MNTGDIKREPKVMGYMLSKAHREGMLEEVVSSFDEYRAAGDDIREAARCALLDWDVA